MPPRQRTAPNTDVKHHLLAFFLMITGLALCLVNVLYLLNVIVDVSHHHHPSRIRQPRQSYARDLFARYPEKKRLLEILLNAGYHNLTESELEQLPTWSQVVKLYGDAPKIVGLDTCHEFQTTVPPSDALIGAAGPFDSGTNLLAELLIHNCVLTEHARTHRRGSNGVRWQVNWGKHSPPRLRMENHVDKDVKNNTVMLPVVAVRDPYSWMQSMCRHRYAAHWFHYAQGHCPNLIPNDVDWEFLERAKNYKFRGKKYHHDDPWLIDNVANTANFTRGQTVIPLYVKYKKVTTNHVSLAHLWNDWYHEYYAANFPRVFVRMEDLVFFSREVVEQVCHCAGGQVPHKFQYITQSAKMGGENVHGKDESKTSLLHAMINYGSFDDAKKTHGMTSDDIDYAKLVFSKELMELFGYRHPITTTTTT